MSIDIVFLNQIEQKRKNGAFELKTDNISNKDLIIDFKMDELGY